MGSNHILLVLTWESTNWMDKSLANNTRKCLFILLQRALHMYLYYLKRGREVEGGSTPSPALVGLRCVCHSRTHTTTKGYQRETEKRSFSCLLRLLASCQNHKTRISFGDLALIIRRDSTGPGSAKKQPEPIAWLLIYKCPTTPPILCSYFTFPLSPCLISYVHNFFYLSFRCRSCLNRRNIME